MICDKNYRKYVKVGLTCNNNEILFNSSIIQRIKFF